ncbi:hypothetical protein PR003_g30658 [Phytophthora rubi]|uniref:Uncharacterized protein n=1 Tax=Phytophthora rubi TaxID=129364 RepID=A0A6A3H1K6_9STRA|nr:hypothetical protein PR002_g29463 [Phytophthora rubi]KAE9270961.1 hypothetical protein PR003_g30658 [Phytophthora rubi]
MDYRSGRLGHIDLMLDDDATNTVVIGALERRDRIDVVHDRLGLPRLDSAHYDIAILEDGLSFEETRLQRRAGATQAPERPPSPVRELASDGRVAGRTPISSHGRVAFQTIRRILDSIQMEPELLADRSKLRQLTKENGTAITAWKRKVLPEFRPPGSHSSAEEFVATIQWLTRHRSALQDLFTYLPYPEVAAKMLPQDLLMRWGELEAYDVQVETLRSYTADETLNITAREFCRAWLAACTADGGSHRDRVVARDPQRWKRLDGMLGVTSEGTRPTGVSEQCWNILHILPYVVWTWTLTPWGRHPRSRLGFILLFSRSASMSPSGRNGETLSVSLLG